MRRVSRRALLGSLGSALVSATAGCAGLPGSDDGGDDADLTAASLPMAQYDAGNTGVRDGAEGPTGSVSVDRTARYPYSGAFLSPQAAIVDGIAYVSVPIWGGGIAAILAVDLADGEIRWRFETEAGPAVTPAVREDLVVVCADGAVRALDRETGDERWAYRLSGAGGNPTVVEDTVYVVDEAPALHAVDVQNGEDRWRRAGEDYRWGHTPAVADGSVVVAVPEEAVTGVDGALLGFDVESGEQRWRTDLPEPSTPVATPEAAYVLDRSGELHRFAVSSGERRWRARAVGEALDDGIGTTGPVVTQDRVYAVGGGGTLACLTPDGERQWIQSLSMLPSGAPVATGETVYVCGMAPAEGEDSSGTVAGLWGVSPDGTVRLEQHTRGSFGPPAVGNGAVYCGALLGARGTFAGLVTLE